MSSFSSISTALTALQAHRRAMDVTGNNIANVNTPGYTRQRVDLQPRVAPGAASQFYNQRLAGSGVEVLGTTRMADEFLTARVRSQTSTHADLQARAQALVEVERALGEPSDTGLAEQLSQMWNAWSTLGANPDDLAAKTVLVNKSQAVVDSLASGKATVSALWGDQRAQADALATEVNDLSGRIAKINEAVLNTSTDGAANELVDQRDQLVTRFVELTGATAVPGRDNQVNVYLGGNPAVAGINSYAVVVTGANQLDDSTVAGFTTPGATTKPVKISWATPPTAGQPANAEITLTGGQLSGLFTSLNQTLPTTSQRYDGIATAVARTVNDGYAASGDPRTFFTAVPAATPGGPDPQVKVADLRIVITDPSTVRAGNPTTNGPKDGSVAGAVGALRTAEDGPDALWKSHVVQTGVDVAAARSRALTVFTTLSTAIADQQSATGVSLDEETANLLVQQRAYEGAARVLTAVDQALDTLINRTGLVGR